ncbi:MAG TPA: hypothetical protein VI957_01120 [Candidatus Paceibacterota bacterium]
MTFELPLKDAPNAREIGKLLRIQLEAIRRRTGGEHKQLTEGEIIQLILWRMDQLEGKKTHRFLQAATEFELVFSPPRINRDRIKEAILGSQKLNRKPVG